MMAKLFSALTLAMLAAPAFAEDATVPEPGSLALVAVGALAVYLARRKRK